jgi:flagellar hook protein FlgE
MSLFGAMTAGVSGLAAQSSAMGAIADNIANVNTVGYKNTSIDFMSLVTKQSSATFYSAGGVQSRPRGANDIQGLLQATSSQTDLGISGNGFFVVNQSRTPGASDQYLFTRAGAFSMDNEGYLRNSAGYYLQGWPTDAMGNVVLPPNSTATLTNTNIISNDFLQTINLYRVAGSASPTTTVSIGANLPSNDAVGDSHSVDIQFFDSLGNPNDVSVRFTKAAANQWDLDIEPPSGAAVVTMYDASGAVYRSAGQLEFTAVPTDGQSVDIGGETYVFVNGAAADNEIEIGGGRTVATVVADLITQVNADLAGAPASTKSGSSTTLLLEGVGGDVAVDPTNLAGSVVQTQAFTVLAQTATAPAITFDGMGVPSAFGVDRMEVTGFESGAADMNGSAGGPEMITVSLGTIGEANGMTQLGGDFTIASVRQDGSRFGSFSGVSIGSDGLMVALFDNGERRPIFRLPVATFVNPSGLEGRSGNVWNVTESSGTPTLRTADEGPAGEIIQASLESSTVDIGEEFTNMIVVQRAYSAATKIISTADEMLDELVRIKR